MATGFSYDAHGDGEMSLTEYVERTNAVIDRAARQYEVLVASDEGAVLVANGAELADFEESIAQFEKVTKMSPRDGKDRAAIELAYLSLGRVLFEVGRYHSLCAERETLPDELVVTARTDQGEIMGVRHKTLPIEGVQFHPESVLTPEGDRLMSNFMQLEMP